MLFRSLLRITRERCAHLSDTLRAPTHSRASCSGGEHDAFSRNSQFIGLLQLEKSVVLTFPTLSVRHPVPERRAHALRMSLTVGSIGAHLPTVGRCACERLTQPPPQHGVAVLPTRRPTLAVMVANELDTASQRIAGQKVAQTAVPANRPGSKKGSFG